MLKLASSIYLLSRFRAQIPHRRRRAKELLAWQPEQHEASYFECKLMFILLFPKKRVIFALQRSNEKGREGGDELRSTHAPSRSMKSW